MRGVVSRSLRGPASRAGNPIAADEWPLARALAQNKRDCRRGNHRAAISEGRADVAARSARRRCAMRNGITVAVVATFLDITQRKTWRSRLSAKPKSASGCWSRTRQGFRDLLRRYQGPGGSCWNKGAERMLGWTEQRNPRSAGRHPVHARGRAAAWCREEELRQARETGRAIDERWHVRKDGTRFWASGVLTSVRAADGAVTGFVKIMRDDDRSQAGRGSPARRRPPRRERARGRGRRGQPRQGRIHRDGEPRAAHAAQHHPAVGAHAAQRTTLAPRIVPRASRWSSAPRSRSSRSSTTCSMCRASPRASCDLSCAMTRLADAIDGAIEAVRARGQRARHPAVPRDQCR